MAKAPQLVRETLHPATRAKLDKAITEWRAKSDAASKAADELETARVALVEVMGADKWPEGDNTADIGFGKKLVVKCPFSRSIDEAILDAKLKGKQITADEINALVNYKPNLKVGEWKNLDEERKKIWGDIVTEKRGKVAISFEDKKR